MNRKLVLTAILAVACVEFGTTTSRALQISNPLDKVAAVNRIAGKPGGTLLLGHAVGSGFRLDLKDLTDNAPVTDTMSFADRPVGAAPHPFDDDHFLVATADGVSSIEYDYDGDSRFVGVSWTLGLAGSYASMDICDLDVEPTTAQTERAYLTVHSSNTVSSVSYSIVWISESMWCPARGCQT